MILQHCQPCIRRHLLSSHSQQISPHFSRFLIHFFLQKVNRLQFIPIFISNNPLLFLCLYLQLLFQLTIQFQIIQPLINRLLIIINHILIFHYLRIHMFLILLKFLILTDFILIYIKNI
jgi:hypothetical protein